MVKEVATAAQPINLDATIDAWFKEYFHGWVQYEVSLYNHAYAAKEALKKALSDQQVKGE